MQIKISEKIAESIVEAIYEVCQCPINFMDQSGIILASTDRTRIHQFHEASLEVIKREEAVFVKELGKYTGTKIGVNYPIFIEGKTVAVVGITGDPEKVGKFGFLATKISEVFIHEIYISNVRKSSRQKMNYLIRALIYNHIENELYINQLRDEFGLNEESYRVVCIQVHQRYHEENMNLVERKIESLFERMGIVCYTYLYPNEFVGFLKDEGWEQSYGELERFCNQMKPLVKAGVSTRDLLSNSSLSYEEAKYAICCIEEKEIVCQLYCELGLERALRVLRKHLNQKYLEFVLRELDEGEKDLLCSYFENNMSLKETASENFIHINTLQNRLKRMEEKNGLNPRNFKDAVALYIGIRVEKMQK